MEEEGGLSAFVRNVGGNSEDNGFSYLERMMYGKIKYFPIFPAQLSLSCIALFPLLYVGREWLAESAALAAH